MREAKVVIICGPTGSGKTTLAFRLAGNQPTSIISADSRQVYQGLDVLTGKDIPTGFHKEKDYYTKGSLRLFGFDLIRPDETMSAAQYSKIIRQVLAQEIKQNRQVIIVGGTGFYLKALTQPNSLAGIMPDKKLREGLNQLTIEQLQQKLKEVNPKRLASMNQSDISNPRRLVRAIEVASAPTTPTRTLLVGETYKTYEESPRRFVWIGLSVPLEALKERIAARVDSRLPAAIVEVSALCRSYPDRGLPIYTSLGVKPILRYLGGEITRGQLHDPWVIDEVNYAKRQLTWFKKQSQIIWYDKRKTSRLSIESLI